jgi:hypothetical protein
MSDKPLPQSEMVLYQTEDGRTRVQCRFENETVWLTQQHMAELFQTSKQNVSLHIHNIFADGELHEDSVVKESLTTAADGKKYATNFYNLDVIIAVGWGRRYLLSVVEGDAKPSVRLSHRKITLRVRPGSRPAKREEVMHGWHKALLHEFVPRLIRKWEAKIGVTVSGYFLQRMKTKWGGCNHRAGNIRLNTELVKKPKDLLEYVVVHEMLHLIEPTHSDRFVTLLSSHYPAWREARAELNELPLGAEAWKL